MRWRAALHQRRRAGQSGCEDARVVHQRQRAGQSGCEDKRGVAKERPCTSDGGQDSPDVRIRGGWQKSRRRAKRNRCRGRKVAEEQKDAGQEGEAKEGGDEDGRSSTKRQELKSRRGRGTSEAHIRTQAWGHVAADEALCARCGKVFCFLEVQ